MPAKSQAVKKDLARALNRFCQHCPLLVPPYDCHDSLIELVVGDISRCFHGGHMAKGQGAGVVLYQSWVM